MLSLHNLDYSAHWNIVGAGSVDLCITSPPYKKDDGYSPKLIHTLGEALKTTLKPGALAFVNFGHVKEDPLRVYAVPLILGYYLNFVQEFAWLKSYMGQGRFTPINSTKYTNRLWEPVYCFANGPNWSLDRESLAIPYKDKSNTKRFKKGKNTGKRCQGDVLFAPYENRSGKGYHPHKYPNKLVSMLVSLSGIQKGSTVLDPFIGGGTTAQVCQELEMHCIGFEKQTEWYDYIMQQRNNEIRITK